MSIAFFDRNPVGRLVTRLTNDVSTIEQVLSQGVVEAVYSVLLLIAIVGAMFVPRLAPGAGDADLRAGLIYFVRRFAIALRDTFRLQRAWLARVNAFLNENITGMAVVQLFNRQRRNLGRFDERNRGLLGANLQRDVLLRRVRADRGRVQRGDDRRRSSGTAAASRSTRR